jgi:hypothetical protein
MYVYYINGFTSRNLCKIRRNYQVIRLCIYWLVLIVGSFFYNVAIYGELLWENPWCFPELRV